jgi:uncharacterized protein
MIPPEADPKNVMHSSEYVDNFHVLLKPTGAICNLDCKYCFYLEKEQLYPKHNSEFRMSEEVLERYTRDYIRSQKGPKVTFAWQGGEPTLLGVDYYRRAIALQKQYADGKEIINTLQTNAVLLDNEWAEFFAQEQFLIGVSIDGPRTLHDYYRVAKGGQPTFNRVMRGIDALKRHGVEFNTLTCVQRNNSYYPLEVYRFLKEVGSGYMQFIPIAERKPISAVDPHVLVSPEFQGNAQVTDWSVEPEQFGIFLTTIFDEWVRKDVGKIFVQLFDVSLEMWAGYTSSLCVFKETCGAALALEHTGDLYSCDHFVYQENKLGNIMEQGLKALAHSEQQAAFGIAKRESLPAYCRNCHVRFACNGECPKHRFLRTPDGEPGLNYLCKGYKRFFHHVDPYMRYMSEQLRQGMPPSNVMQWIRQRDLQSAGYATPGRNDLCVCGSGRKFKKCCGARQ